MHPFDFLYATEQIGLKDQAEIFHTLKNKEGFHKVDFYGAPKGHDGGGKNMRWEGK